MCLSVSQDHVYHFINEPKSWAEAQTFCRKYYTDLATVNHMRDLERLRAAAGGQTDVWTGLHQTSDKLADRKWLWSQPDVKYKLETMWKIGEPTDDVNENCAVIYRDGKWIDIGCETLRSCFICYNETSNTTVLINEQQTWLEAQQFCRTHHTDLMSGPDQQRLFEATNPDHSDKWCWIGLSRDNWGWSDGSDSSFRNWKTEVNPKDHKCAALMVGQGRFESKNCSHDKPFICCNGSLCHTYHFINESKSWVEAQTFCRVHFTDLATVNHMRDLERLRAAAKEQTDVWIGLYQTSNDLIHRKWLWSQPEIKYSEEWAQGEPSDNGEDRVTREDCAVITAGGSWVDTHCGAMHLCFVCYNESSNTVVWINNSLTWLEAQQYCRANHTDLMSGPDQQRLFEAKYPNRPDKWCWIGLSRDTWGWSDGSDSTFRNLKTYVNPYSKKCAALVDQGQWKDDNCTENKPFICYDGHPLKGFRASPTFASLFELQLSLIASVHPGEREETWMEAYDYCNQNYCKLAFFLDHKYLKTMVQVRAEMADTEFVWVGLFYSCAMKTWMWVNGRYVDNDNNNWKHPGEQNDCSVAGAIEKQRGNDKWVKINDKEKHNFICLR
ncbi:hypothetical protein WMY93_015081 [Mugilogobius chulae]|uniref:C-type lectin domain-containing protein n=1 Tax=Mugilogobius chulae TaxID=88201 RepID=A0AAW0NWT2_9GOBI